MLGAADTQKCETMEVGVVPSRAVSNLDEVFAPTGSKRSSKIGESAQLDDLEQCLERVGASENRIPVSLLSRVPELRNPSLFRDRTSTSFRIAKRATDITASVGLLLMSLPISLVVVVAIMFDSGRPFLFCQERIGKDGKTFRLYKYRSMIEGAPTVGPLSTTIPNDPRITSVGRIIRRIRLDEIPQLWNVLRGDMSLIGPRPELPKSHVYLCGKFPGFSLRTTVRPGITGWAQVTSGYADTLAKHERRLEHDLYYVREATFRMDWTIACRTAKVIVTSKGH